MSVEFNDVTVDSKKNEVTDIKEKFINSSNISSTCIQKKDLGTCNIPSKNYAIYSDNPGNFYLLLHRDISPIGNGSFGIVYKSNILIIEGPVSFSNIDVDFLSAPLSIYENIDSTTCAFTSTDPLASVLPSTGQNELVAVKKVLQDKRFKNRELFIMRKLDHFNIVKLKYYFLTQDDKDELYLSLVIGYMPETIYSSLKSFIRKKQAYPIFYIKLFSFQIFRALMFIHSMSICHRDIKPQNLLVDYHRGILKLCDFGSAKILNKDESNVSYICSRFYRAPELIFGSSNYEVSIDIWSTGCVISELILGNPLFSGQSGVDQLVEIIKVLGTPTKEQIRKMNPNYSEFRFPIVQTSSWNKVFKYMIPDSLIDLISQIIIYSPVNRINASAALLHPFFGELFTVNKLPDESNLPNFFEFSEYEYSICPDLKNLFKISN